MSKRRELEAENAELRERWRSCVDTIDALRSAFYEVHELSLLPFDDNDRRAISVICRRVLQGEGNR